MKAVEVIEQAKTKLFNNSDDENCLLKLQPPGTAKEIAKLEKELGMPLPAELREVIEYCQGFEWPSVEANFVGDLSYGSDLLPHGLPIAGDGFGNFWILDLTKDAPQSTTVFFASHDPPVLVYQADSLGQFLAEILKDPESKSEADRVHDECAMQIWAENPNVLTHEIALAGDDELKAFAATLDNSYLFIDLRTAKTGDGFSWGRYGATTVGKRYGEKRIFAYQQRKLSWLQKMFGV